MYVLHRNVIKKTMTVCVKSFILQYAMQWFFQYSEKILYVSYYKT